MDMAAQYVGHVQTVPTHTMSATIVIRLAELIISMIYHR